MTYQGARVQPAQDESTRVFEVLKVRLDSIGRVSDVLWTEVDTKSGGELGGPVRAALAEVIDALHDGARVAAVFATAAVHVPERWFVVEEHEDGRESVVLGPPSAPGRELSDLPLLST
jgi:hypothetical protein